MCSLPSHSGSLPPGNAPRCILMIDHEFLRLHQVARGLERRGLEVVCATSLDDAAEYLGQQSFDLALFDARMPTHNGWVLFPELVRGYGLPMIQLVERGDLCEDRRSRGVEDIDYLLKPFRIDDLIARIEVLSQKSSIAV